MKSGGGACQLPDEQSFVYETFAAQHKADFCPKTANLLKAFQR